MFIYVGKSITSQNDELTKLSLKDLFGKIKNPKIDFIERIKQLRITQTIDKNRYKELKKTLPYFTCGNFHPNFRKKENFSSIQCFVIDIDHLNENEVNILDLKEKIIKNKHVFGLFVSPGGDGLKILFSLNETIKDSSVFQSFYKIFSVSFAKEFFIENCVDYKTSDVTRACFVSYDNEAYFNEFAEPILLNSYLKIEDFESVEFELREVEKFAKELSTNRNNENKTLTEDILKQIQQKLNPTNQKIISKKYYLPPEIDELIPLIEKQVQDFEINLVEKNPIHYGRKLKFKAGIFWAELNIFYGKKGYSIVKTPKNGSNQDLAESCYQIVSNILCYGETKN